MGRETYRKLVQIGRVVYLNEGRYKGKLATIVDIIDANKALIDGPCSKVPRQGFKFSEMHLTKYLLKINRSQRSKILRGVWAQAGIDEKFKNSLWSKNLHKGELREAMTDYDLYKLGRSRQSRNKILNRAHFSLKKKRHQMHLAKKNKRRVRLQRKKEEKVEKPKAEKPKAVKAKPEKAKAEKGKAEKAKPEKAKAEKAKPEKGKAEKAKK